MRNARLDHDSQCEVLDRNLSLPVHGTGEGYRSSEPSRPGQMVSVSLVLQTLK